MSEVKAISRSITVATRKYVKNWVRYRGNILGISVYFLSITFYALLMNHSIDFEGLSFAGYVLASFAIYNIISFSLSMYSIFTANKEVILSLPIPPWIYALGRMAGQLTTSTLFSGLLILFVIMSQQLFVNPHVLPLLFISIFFSLVFSCGIGFFMAGIGLRYVSLSNIPSLLQIVLLFVCGVLTPLSMLPGEIRYISYMIPYTYCVDIVRGLLLNYPTILPLPVEIILIVSLSMVFFFIGKVFLSIMVENIRKKSLIVLR